MLVDVTTLAHLRRTNAILGTSKGSTELTNPFGCLWILGLDGRSEGQVKRQLNLLTVVQVEWRKSGRRLLGTVDCYLKSREVLVPVGLVPIDETTKHLLERTIRSFRLTIGLRMIGRAHRELGAELVPECAPEMRSEPRVAITQD